MAKGVKDLILSLLERRILILDGAMGTMIQDAGLVFSGVSPDGILMEVAELPRDKHPFFLGTQFHPELKSRPLRPHPLFAEFIRAALFQAMSSG